jgi:hypothetical protein
LLAGLLLALALSQARTLPFLGEHVPASLLHPLFLAGQGLLLALLATLLGDWRRLRAGRRGLRRWEHQEGDTWAAALTDDLLTAGFPERFPSVPASPEDALEAEEALDAACAAEFAGRVRCWTECLRRRWRRYWLLALLLLPPGLAVTALGLAVQAFGARHTELFLPLDVATAETVVVCLLALWLRYGWQRLLGEWRRRAGVREVQLALFPDLVLPWGSPEEQVAVPAEADGDESNGQGQEDPPPGWEGEPVAVVEWSDAPAEMAVTPPTPAPTTLATARPTVLGDGATPPAGEQRSPEARWQGDLQLVEDDEA